MATDVQNDLASFHKFVGEQLADPNIRISPEEALAQWRHLQTEIGAIQEGLKDVDEGRTIPLNQFLREFRERHNLPEDA